MTDLKQLIEKGATAQMASAAYSSFWSVTDHKVMIKEGILAILPLLADDLAGVAKTGWVSADYAVVGIADADQCMKLCEHIESEIRTRIAAIIEGEGK